MAKAKAKSVKVAAPDELIAAAKAKIVRAKYYNTGKTDKFGKIVGYREFPEGSVPFEHQVHHHDEQGRVVFFEKFSREFSKPSLRVFHYQDWHVVEAVWIDRYGRVENYHRYDYDTATNLLAWRAEYNHEGQLYYYILSKYDEKMDHIEDAWFDARDKQVKRLTYKNDATGEPLEQAEYDESDQLVGTLKLKYDKRGNVVERAWHNPKGDRMSRFVYSYDPKDFVVKVELRAEKDNLEAKQEFGYDAVGNVISEKWYDQQGKLYKDLRFEGSTAKPAPAKILAKKR